MTKNKAYARGFLRATADTTANPLQTRLSLIITDFAPNGNKQGIPKKEKDNIINSALHMPLKINFDGVEYAGHDGAIPIGPIINVYEDVDNGREIIAGDAIIWNEVYDDISEHLKKAFSEGIGTSWEIYYDTAEIDESGNEWLHGCIFAGTCVVQVPAYGPNRTRILAIAEKLHDRETELMEISNNMAGNAQADDLSVTREDLNDASDLLMRLWEGLDSLYNRTFEIEAATVETDIGVIAETFAEKISKIAERINSLSEKLGINMAELETVTAERNQLKQEREAIAEQTKLVNRKNKLAEAGIDDQTFNTRADFYQNLSDEAFSVFADDLISAYNRGNKSKAESSLTNPIIPEPLQGSGEDHSFTNAELGAELRKLFRR